MYEKGLAEYPHQLAFGYGHLDQRSLMAGWMIVESAVWSSPLGHNPTLDKTGFGSVNNLYGMYVFYQTTRRLLECCWRTEYDNRLF
jgi:hypothetical protein